MEQLSNNSSATLVGAINSVVTSLTVNSASLPIPQLPQFRIGIDREIMLVTAGPPGTTWTVTRGAENTVATTHANGAAVTLLATAGAMFQWLADNFGPSYPVTPTPSTGWTWINQSGATVQFNGGFMYIEQGSSGGPNPHNIQYRAAPTPPYTIRIKFKRWAWAGASVFTSFNLLFLDSGSGKFSNIQITNNAGSPEMYVEKWTNATTFSAQYRAETLNSGPYVPEWLFIQDDGVNRHYGWSFDGAHWYTYFTVGRTDFLTPDSVGVSIRTDGSLGVSTSIECWNVSSP